jgi:hypothetical protein
MENPSLAKAEGMVRFNLSGKLPLSEQDWPEILSQEKVQYVSKLVDKNQ